MIEFGQKTLARKISCSGLGVHSGRTVHLTLHPAPVNHGIQFVRTDLPVASPIKAHFNNVVDTSLATVIGDNGQIVSTIEHLMSAFAAFSIDNVLVALDSYEVPVMDGSAREYVRLLKEAGTVRQSGPKCYFVIKEPIILEEGAKSVALYPASGFNVTCAIDFPHPLIQKQSISIDLTPERYAEAVADARTFGFLNEVEMMRRLGLARGGSLENAVVLDEKGVLNPDGLRFPDEFVRHKALDCIGDFALLGMPILGKVVANRSGHAFHHAFLTHFFNSKSSWETLTIHDFDDWRRAKARPMLQAMAG